jgi:pimeloyl-ACP methyl ester carboxylesterase
VLLLSHGLGLSRASYTALAVELASHGYAVAAIDHPRGGATVLGDGSVLTTEDDPELEAHWQERGMEWVDDFRFVLDELARRFPERTLAFERVGVIGHSMGGAAALASGRRVERIAACVDLDGAPLAITEHEGLARPSLFVKSEPDYSDEELAAKGRKRPEGPRTGPWEAITARGTASCLYVGFHGTGHLSFSDAPFVMPDTITRFGGRIVPFERAHALLARLLLAFFDVHLRGGPEQELLALDAEEELELFALSPSER